MRHIILLKYAFLLFCLVLAVSACTVFSAAPPDDTPTPQPTSGIPDLQVTSTQACLVTTQVMIRVDHPQGDLIAWSPVDDTLVYIASTQNSSWNVGDLHLLSPADFDSPLRLATQVAGELTWDPDGSTIAYLGLRRKDNLYTIGLAYPNGRASRDLFPDEAARTDDYSSQKAILNWINSGRLRALVSCGINCMQMMDFGVLSGLSSLVGEPIERSWDMLAVHTFHPDIIPPMYANLPGQLNWSPDESRIAYIDANDNTWIISTRDDTLFPLDVGQYATATETDWSYDSQYLAIQVDQWIKIFSFNCP
jgi:hypothetical protein